MYKTSIYTYTHTGVSMQYIYYTYIYIYIYNTIIKINKKERKACHNTPKSLGSWKKFFCLFGIKSWGTLFSILYHFFLNLLYSFPLFKATLLFKFLILLILFRRLLKHINLHFLVLYQCSLSKSSLWHWIRKVSLSKLWKPKMAVCCNDSEKCKQSGN